MQHVSSGRVLYAEARVGAPDGTQITDGVMSDGRDHHRYRHGDNREKPYGVRGAPDGKTEAAAVGVLIP
jgi:hypothetical protein